jgi:hypothetical protein
MADLRVGEAEMASGTRLSRQNQANGESIAENTIEFRLQDVRSPAEPALFNTSTPARSRCVAKLCRSVCTVAGCTIPAANRA